MTHRRQRLFWIALLASLSAGCSSHGVVPGQNSIHMATPRSISPALIPPAPMAKTAILPPSAMSSPIRPMSAIQDLNWTEIPGAAVLAAAAPDGSLWVLSTQPAGPDKFIWHWALGAWTNISGAAKYLSIAPNGDVYAVNSGGGTYIYNGSGWTALGGGASGITAAADNSLYVLSNSAPLGTDQAIWHNVNGTWTQVPGSGVTVAASWDTAGPFVEPAGSINAGGFYILNAAGQIWYENSDGSFAQLPGSASAIAPTQVHGIFTLDYPANANGNAISYYDLNTSTSTVQSGAGVSISASSSTLYAVASWGGIFSTPIAVVPQRVFVPNYTSSSSASISAWPISANGNVAAALQISGSATTLVGPTAVTRDASGTTYVADFDASAIDVFAPGASGNVAPIRRIVGPPTGSLTQISGPEGIGVDAAGNIYVSNRTSNAVTVYGPSADGNVAPIRTISGSNTNLSAPQQLVVNPGGGFYVSNSAGNSIDVFDNSANGNVAPIHIISGSATGLDHTFGVALDSAGDIFALNGTSITIYTSGAAGNVAPVRTISGSNTGLNANEGIAVDNSGNIYVTECATAASVLVFSATASGNVAPVQTIAGSSTGLRCPLKPAIF